MTATSPITSIEGTWYIDGMPFDEDGILVIMKDGRTIQFPTSVTKPRMNQTMRLWHSGFDGESIQFRNAPHGRGWLRRIELSSNGWDMIADSDGEISRFHCQRADLASLPDWYPEMLEKNLTKMSALEDEKSNAEQGVDPNA
tara:strand:+ start:142 stop:567 length:426 start_codon:yes stop_codon:yes gene_type:complete